ncbi:MAG TPA: GreA/GreB family elongation factor [Steroidobacteraceae bacterium]|jgi:transcription elongation GreA/GreB family factor|nr:GreA/GreB family elongation factor [Steroidobacteraceae bacterium]
MSRAFVREGDGSDPLPERAVSPHPNLVTPRGLAGLESRVRELEGERAAARAAADQALTERVERDLRYFGARRASARVIAPGTAADKVRFGTKVTLATHSGEQVAFRLVGEDEADVAQGLLSWVSPLAQTLLGREPGETVQFQGADAEIVSIEP